MLLTTASRHDLKNHRLNRAPASLTAFMLRMLQRAAANDASQQASGGDPEKENAFDQAERTDAKNAAAITASAASHPIAASTTDPKTESLADTDGTHEELLDAWYWLIRPGQIVLAAEFDDDDEVVGWWEAEVIDVTGEAYMVQFPSDMKAGILPRDEEHIYPEGTAPPIGTKIKTAKAAGQ